MYLHRSWPENDHYLYNALKVVFLGAKVTEIGFHSLNSNLHTPAPHRFKVQILDEQKCNMAVKCGTFGAWNT